MLKKSTTVGEVARKIASWVRELSTTEYENGRGIGRTSECVIRSREGIAQDIEDGVWRHTARCRVNTSSDGIRARCNCEGRP